MQALTQAGQLAVQDLSQRYGISQDAVSTMLTAVAAGNGNMAQFYHPELGGGGQWMRGGMTMVGDMFNNNLQSLVSNLCGELSDLLGRQQLFAPSKSGGQGGNNWWPQELGQPSSSGGQNDSKYAVFPNARRLAIHTNGTTQVYDTLDHQIGGVQQQQSGYGGSLEFSSQFGTFAVNSLPLANSGNNTQPQPPAEPQYAPPPAEMPQHSQNYQQPQNSQGGSSSQDIFTAIERLGELRDRNILSQAEFDAKKSELFARL